ncbi:hypothetical protein F2P79_012561 [Pimephales promelas]|nr:hypothetical protein F2P79_012561 [Pimephales promelas]
MLDVPELTASSGQKRRHSETVMLQETDVGRCRIVYVVCSAHRKQCTDYPIAIIVTLHPES